MLFSWRRIGHASDQQPDPARLHQPSYHNTLLLALYSRFHSEHPSQAKALLLEALVNDVQYCILVPFALLAMRDIKHRLYHQDHDG